MTRWAAALVALAAAACDPSDPLTGAPSAPPASAAPSLSAPAPSPSTVTRGDAERGRALVARFECNRCHEVAGLEAAPREKHCVRCHEDILAGRFEAPADALAAWRKNIVHLRAAPSLRDLGEFLRPEWITAFLLYPYELRPRLHASMPRLAITQAEAEDVAAFLTGAPGEPAAAQPLGDVERGRRLFGDKGCGSCHLFSGSGVESAVVGADPAIAIQLAPDLQHSRGRLKKGAIFRWLLDPQSLKPDTTMPKTPLSDEEARDLAAFVMQAMVTPSPPKPMPSPLPLLDRPVGYDEVSQKVFRKICWHCHAQPDFARGDGGPGMSGGFGFAGRQLDLSSYEAIQGGYLDDKGERASTFRLAPDGTPMLVAVMLARQAEEAGRPGALRGMPLGLPSMSPEQIQLVASWIAQGRPQ